MNSPEDYDERMTEMKTKTVPPVPVVFSTHFKLASKSQPIAGLLKSHAGPEWDASQKAITISLMPTLVFAMQKDKKNHKTLNIEPVSWVFK